MVSAGLIKLIRAPSKYLKQYIITFNNRFIYNSKILHIEYRLNEI